MERTQSIEIFLSYDAASREDDVQRKELEKQLCLLPNVTVWHAGKVDPGQEYEQEIEQHIKSAHIILLLVSVDFLNSAHCTNIELPYAMERYTKEAVRVIPLILRPCSWENTPFRNLQPLPRNKQPITSQVKKEQALASIADEIRMMAEELQTNIRRTSSDPFIYLPYERNIFFTGRETILANLYQAFQAEKTRYRPQALCGLGGTGKTQIALEYAYQHQNEYRAIFWTRADTNETLLADLVTIAQILDVPTLQKQDSAQVFQVMKYWLQTHDQWLLILDNADDLSIVRDLLPTSIRGHILYTTRAQATGGQAHPISVERLSTEEAKLFLLRRSRHIDLSDTLDTVASRNKQLASDIIDLMDGLPLALDQAGAFIEETQCSLEEYIKLFHTQQAALLKRRGHWDAGHPDPVATTWSLSFEKVQSLNSTATDLLRLCSFFDSEAIPEAIFIKGAQALGPTFQHLKDNPVQFHELLGILLHYSLVRRNPNQTFDIHRLVQAILQHNMNKKTQRQWAERAIKAIVLTFPSLDYETWPLCQQYLPHGLRCTTFIQQWNMVFPEAATLLSIIGRLLHDQGKYKEAAPIYQCALVIREQILGKDHPDTATSLNNLATLYKRQGKYEKAVPLCQRALTIYGQVRGYGHPSTATCLNTLATLYKHQGKYEEGVSLYQQALTIREQALGYTHPSTALCLNNLATLYKRQGKYEEAISLCQRALAIYEQVLGYAHPDTATYLNNLAGFYKRQGKYEEALPRCRQALTIYENTLGLEHPFTATCLSNLADLTYHQGKYEEAMSHYQRALTIYENTLGPEHPSTIALRQELSQREQ